MTLLRVVSLTVWAAGLTPVRRQGRGDQISTATGLGWRARLPTAVLVLGGLSLAGFPLTPGFAGRWTAASLLADARLGQGILLLAGSASAVIGVLRMATVLLARDDEEQEPVPKPARWEWLTTVALAAVVSGAVLFSIFPVPLLRIANEITNSLTFLP